MKNKWEKLLSAKRFSRDGKARLELSQEDPNRSPFQADYDRVIYSTPFRRLARKTQVHPLAMNDHVRTRLTHSLEVVSVGRSLGVKLAKFLKDKGDVTSESNLDDIIWIMMSACAVHDIGNPPFGHAGEYALREWICRHQNDIYGNKPKDISQGIKSDLELFEGNAQGFRLASRADNPKNGYLRLTVATLGAMIKYPWDSTHDKAKEKKKFNCFFTEKELFDCMMSEMELKKWEDSSYQRHPMSFLTEAADDICYRVLDLEDAVEIGILNPNKVRNLYKELSFNRNDNGLSSDDNLPLEALRGKAILHLINEFWHVFEENYDDIINGQREEDLRSGLNATLVGVLGEIKDVYDTIFAEKSKVSAELGAYKALGRIVKALCFATDQLASKGKYEDAGFLSQRCLELAWGREYAKQNEKESYEWWLHQVMDYVSGLTDNYARRLSREIEGT